MAIGVEYHDDDEKIMFSLRFEKEGEGGSRR